MCCPDPVVCAGECRRLQFVSPFCSGDPVYDWTTYDGWACWTATELNGTAKRSSGAPSSPGGRLHVPRSARRPTGYRSAGARMMPARAREFALRRPPHFRRAK